MAVKCLVCKKDIPLLDWRSFWGHAHFIDGTKSDNFNLCVDCLALKPKSHWVGTITNTDFLKRELEKIFGKELVCKKWEKDD